MHIRSDCEALGALSAKLHELSMSRTEDKDRQLAGWRDGPSEEARQALGSGGCSRTLDGSPLIKPLLVPLKLHSMGPPGWGQSGGLEWVRCGEWLKMEVLSHYEYRKHGY